MGPANVSAGVDSPSRQRWERVYSPTMHKDTFNADFFTAAATLIPLFYLALTLQGSLYERMISNLQKVFDELANPRMDGSRKLRNWRALQVGIISAALICAVVTVVLFGALGEWRSILALYYRSASPDTAGGVLHSLLGLLIVVIAGPALRLAGLVLYFGQAQKKASQPISQDPEKSPE